LQFDEARRATATLIANDFAELHTSKATSLEINLGDTDVVPDAFSAMDACFRALAAWLDSKLFDDLS